MATRANVIVQTGPSTFKLIYTHSDGYPSYMGVYLDRFHNTAKAAKEIVKLGAMSSLDARLAPNEGEKHGFSYADMAAFCSVFFDRDRGDGLKVGRQPSLEKALECCGNEHVYVWLTGRNGWLYADMDDSPESLTDLKNLAVFIRGDEACQRQIAHLDEQGKTLEWRDAGCPHVSEEGEYFTAHKPMPVGWVSETEKRAQSYTEQAIF